MIFLNQIDLYSGAFSNKHVKPFHRLCCLFGNNQVINLSSFKDLPCFFFHFFGDFFFFYVGIFEDHCLIARPLAGFNILNLIIVQVTVGRVEKDYKF